MIRLFAHKLAHLMGWNHGTAECWHDENGRLMAGFKCTCCDRMYHVHCAEEIMHFMEHDLRQHANRIAKRRGEPIPYPDVPTFRPTPPGSGAAP